MGWGLGEVALADASVSGLTVTVPAALLALVVWRLSGKIKWPGHLSLTFILTHLLLSCVFAFVWMVIPPILSAIIFGEPVSDLQWNGRVYSWRLLMGIWLYVIVAGLSYATRMSVRLRQQQQISAQAEALAAKANLASMRSQLQPHFLFNALHSVSSLIHSDREKAVEAMEMLGDLLRYAIRDRQSDSVLLGEEWQFVSDYIELQKLRFGNSLDVIMSRDDNLTDVKVPPFVLQPLVENAFVHGISSLPDGGTVEIRATQSADNLVMTVADNGVGISNHELSNGTGIENLRLRLQAIYGDMTEVSITPEDSGGTVASITLPLS